MRKFTQRDVNLPNDSLWIYLDLQTDYNTTKEGNKHLKHVKKSVTIFFGKSTIMLIRSIREKVHKRGFYLAKYESLQIYLDLQTN